MTARYCLALDTSNEVVALGLGRLDAPDGPLTCVDEVAVEAARASNTRLVPEIEALLERNGVARGELAAICCGRGPGSFTGVRICMATAKGLAQGLGAALWGVPTLDAVAWAAWADGARGTLAVGADAMRKEIYPAVFDLREGGVARRNPDHVVKAAPAVDELLDAAVPGETLLVSGDAWAKYAVLLDERAAERGISLRYMKEGLRTATGRGLLLALDAERRTSHVPLDDARAHDPALALPIYTRLSDAEEHERARLAATAPKNLATGVGDRAGMLAFHPLDAGSLAAVHALSVAALPQDAWSEAGLADELGRADRIWWVAREDGGDVAGAESAAAGDAATADAASTGSAAGRVVGYVGAQVVGDDLQILQLAVDPAHRGRGVARRLLSPAAAEARDLGAVTSSLEVRASNPARDFYSKVGYADLGVRPRYYADGEDAHIMSGPLPIDALDVAGMELLANREAGAGYAAGGAVGEGAAGSDAATASADGNETPVQATAFAHPLILAIESSCDETAAAIVDGEGRLLSDVVASQIDFHARFGGVVPEIASRKHVEAICGVVGECVERVRGGRVALSDLDAVAVTYAPGLVGALVVGQAYAKGLAFALDVPLVGVNHLEGHVYANKIATPDLEPPMLVSLVSGGHTMLVHARGWGDYVTLGSTIDDAVGEAFDKVAKAMGLGYPGGPVISRLAAQGDPRAIDFPRALMHSKDYRFSLSGLKTAVINHIRKLQDAGAELPMADVAASFQAAVVDVQVSKARTALLETGARELCVGGGVAANPALRAAYESMCDDLGVRLTLPPLSACTDNAAMIALCALDRYHQGRFMPFDADVAAHAPLDEEY